MIFSRILRIAFKTISALTAGIFLFAQVALAGELLEYQDTTPRPEGVSLDSFQSNHLAALSITVIKNVAEQFSAISGCTYFDSGRLSSKTLNTADENGAIYYHYLDEDWKGLGYGRIDSSRYLVPHNGRLVYSANEIIITGGAIPDPGEGESFQYIGELSYTYTYYDDADGRLATKTAYSDADWTTPIAVYTYYNDPDNRVMSRTDIVSGTVETYYNDPTGRLESKTLLNPDSYNNNYYHYKNENWNGRGYGRIDKTASRDLSGSQSSNSYSYYGDSDGRLQTKNSYSDSDWTILIDTRDYSNDEENKIISATNYTYYASSRMESASFSTADSYGNIYYRYLDEDWKGRGYGRIDRSVRQFPIGEGSSYSCTYFDFIEKRIKTISISSAGEISYSYSYYDDGTGRLREICAYSASDFTNVVTVYTYFNDSSTRLQSCYDVEQDMTITYYNSGRPESITSSNPFDWLGNVYYHFIDATFTNGYYRIDKTMRQTVFFDSDGNGHPFFFIGYDNIVVGELSYSYDYYNDDKGRLQMTVTGYQDDKWTNPVWTLTDVFDYTYYYPDETYPAKLYIFGNVYLFKFPPELIWIGGDEYVDWEPPGYFWGDTVYPIQASSYDIYSYNTLLSDKFSRAYDLRDDTASINTSTEDFLSPPDPQQEQLSNLNEYPDLFEKSNIDLDYEYEDEMTADELAFLDDLTNKIVENSQTKELSELNVPGAADFAGNFEEIEGRIDELESDLLTLDMKEAIKTRLKEFALKNKVSPSVELVVDKKDWIKVPFAIGSYTASTDTTLTFKGKNTDVTIKVDPWAGTITPIEVNTAVTIYDKNYTEVGIEFQQKYASTLINSEFQGGMYANYKIGDKIVASNATSFGFNLLTDTIISYTSSSLAKGHPEFNISNSAEFRINNPKAAAALAVVLATATSSPYFMPLLKAALARALFVIQ